MANDTRPEPISTDPAMKPAVPTVMSEAFTDAMNSKLTVIPKAPKDTASPDRIRHTVSWGFESRTLHLGCEWTVTTDVAAIGRGGRATYSRSRHDDPRAIVDCRKMLAFHLPAPLRWRPFVSESEVARHVKDGRAKCSQTPET
ncbi:MAG TPA: hypothetical protein VFZ65_05530 [Planctomycetota bacterium]|nr:hypothetical protein [Planctomycetota bacterium]